MRKVYRLGDDLFIAIAFVSFVIAIVLRLMGIEDLPLGLNTQEVLFLSMVCLLFSIALSLYDLHIK
ncbi:MAG: hypothetical protein DRP76_01315 [Candidatus Omnitrophota bacterium]|nr:MAG: hypothetical protein DRP76_01315 [Candidatus Omnitrophota bacterium]